MNILFVIIVAAIVVGLFMAVKLIQEQSGEKADYENRGNLFTPAERSFLGVLEQALDSRYRIFGKVRLGDLIKPAKTLAAGKRTAALNRINQKHVDFVVCTANELALVGVLELDDQSHGCEDRAGRDEFVDQALAKAGIPVLHFPANKGYAVQNVRAMLAEMMLAGTKSRVVPTVQKAIAPLIPPLDAIFESYPVQPDALAPECLKCSSAMVKRYSVKGRNAGRYFWACSTFPLCRQMEEIGEGYTSSEAPPSTISWVRRREVV
jgi:very-short-patch-repair endonuclease